jgi:hypothetical protein
MTPRVLEDKIGKLPRWAQDYIAHLDQEIREAKAAELAARHAAGNPDDTNTVHADYTRGDFGLPRDSRVEFYLRDDVIGRREHRIEVRVEGDHLHIYGGAPLVMEASSSNVILMKVRDR